MWKDIVKSIAPVLGTALGGPFGGLAAKFIGGKLLGDENAGEEAIEQFVTSANPEMLFQLKQLDKEFELEIARLGLKKEQLAVEDRQDARKLFGINKWPQIVLSAVFILGYFILVYALITGTVTIPEDQKVLLNTLMGVLTAGVANIMQFWFGSSSGSKDKTTLQGK